MLSMLLASSPVSAESPDTLQQQLQEITVTANRIPESTGEIGRSVTVIDREDIQHTSATTLGELLSRLEGIYLVGAGQTPGSNQTIFLRGSNSNQTAIYLDGVRVSDVSSVNGVADLSELPLTSLDRIEILRGAHSTVYGSSAIGGVILLQSRQPDEDGLKMQVQTEGGLFRQGGSQLATGIATGRRWNNGYWIAADADLLTVRGLDATVDTNTVPPEIARDRDNWEKQSFSVATGIESGAWSAQLRYRRTDMQTDIDRSAYTDDDNYTLDYHRDLISSEIRWKQRQWQVGLTGGWTSMERASLNDSSRLDLSGDYDGNFSEDRYTGQQLNGDLFTTFEEDHWSMLAGINASRETMNQEHYFFSNAFGSVFESRTDLDAVAPAANLIAPYLQLRLQGGLLHPELRPLSLVTGVRSVQHSLFGNIYTYEINPSWQLQENSILFASWSSGYNAPSLYQLFAAESYQPWDGAAINPLTRGNRELTPEYSSAMEFGFRQQLANTRFSFSIFRNRTDDIIDYVYLWNGRVPVDSLGTDWGRDDFRGDRYLNIGNQVAYGAELSVHAKLSQRLNAFASMSMVDGYLDIRAASRLNTSDYTLQSFSNGAFLQQAQRLRGLVRRPNTLLAGMDLQLHRRFATTLRVQYVGARNDNYYEPLSGPYGSLGRRAVNDYTLLDLQFNWRVSDAMRITGRVENLTDTRYEEILGFSSRGRGVYLRISYSI